MILSPVYWLLSKHCSLYHILTSAFLTQYVTHFVVEADTSSTWTASESNSSTATKP